MNSIEEGGELRNPEKKHMEVNKESSHHQYHEVNPTKTLFGKLAVIFVGLRIIQPRSVGGRNYVRCVTLLIIVL